MPDDPVTPNAPLGDEQLIAPPSPTSKDGEATPIAAVEPDTRPPISVLYIQAQPGDNMHAFIQAYLSYNFGSSAVIAPAYSWNDFVKALQKYSSIDYLFILSHAIRADLEFGDEILEASEIVARLTESGNIPKVKKEIDIGGCTAGTGPVGLLKLARFFNAPRLTAYTYFHGMQFANFPEDSEFTTATAAEAVLNAALGPWQDYFLKGAPRASDLAHATGSLWVASGKQTLAVPVEWFTQENIESGPPNPPTADAKATYVPRSKAVDRQVRTDQDAIALEKEVSQWEIVASQPHPFYRVIIEPIY